MSSFCEIRSHLNIKLFYKTCSTDCAAKNYAFQNWRHWSGKCTPWDTARPKSMENLILRQDNTPAHRAEDVQLVPHIQLYVEIVSHPPYSQDLPPCVSHPPYSQDLPPCDFAWLTWLKRKLWGQLLDNLAGLRGATLASYTPFSKKWYACTFTDAGRTL